MTLVNYTCVFHRLLMSGNQKSVSFTFSKLNSAFAVENWK